MNNSRTHNSLRNIAFSFGNQFLMILLSFVSRSVFLYCLSVDYLGIQGLFGDILAMLSLADLGFGTAMTYSMYKPLAEKDYKKLAGLTTFYKKIYLLIAFVITSIGLCLIPFLKHLINLEKDIPNITLYYVLYLASTVSSYFVVYKTTILSADQKGYLITKYSSVFNIVTTVVGSVFLLLTRSYTVFLCIQVAFVYIRNIWNSKIAEKNYPFINEKVELPREETKSIFKNIGSAFLYRISGVLINATDNTLISVLINTTAVGLYSNYTIVVAKLSGFVSTLFYSLTASLGNVVVNESKEKRFEIFQVMQSVSVLLSTFCVTCVLFLQQDFIRVWLGDSYLLDDLVLYAVVLNFYFSISLLPIWVYREATGLYRKTRYVMITTAVLNLVFSVILGKMIGLAGVIGATSLARLCTYFWYEPRLLFKEYFGRSCLFYFKGIGKSIVITGFIFVVEYFLLKAFIPDGWITLIIKGFVTALSTILLLVAFYWKEPGTKMLLVRIKVLLRRK